MYTKTQATGELLDDDHNDSSYQCEMTNLFKSYSENSKGDDRQTNLNRMKGLSYEDDLMFQTNKSNKKTPKGKSSKSCRLKNESLSEDDNDVDLSYQGFKKIRVRQIILLLFIFFVCFLFFVFYRLHKLWKFTPKIFPKV